MFLIFRDVIPQIATRYPNSHFFYPYHGYIRFLHVVKPISKTTWHHISVDCNFKVKQVQQIRVLTTSRAFIVVSSLLAATQPSSGEPPSHIPANAAMERAARRYMRRSPSSVMAGTHLKSSRSLFRSGSGTSSAISGRYSGKRAWVDITQE